MLTLDKYNGTYNRSISEYSCLEKDIPNLPTNKGANKPKYKLVNGSIAVVMDTGKVLMFNEEEDRWHEL